MSAHLFNQRLGYDRRMSREEPTVSRRARRFGTMRPVSVARDETLRAERDLLAP